MRRSALLVALLLWGLLGVPAASPEQAAAAAPIRALLIGDSILEGIGATPRRPVMARVAGRRLGWSMTVDGIGGTGYVNTGRTTGNTYGERLERAQFSSYDVVVIEGGHNDWRADPALVADRVRAAVTLVRDRAPRLQLVLIGAYDPPGVRLRAPVDALIAAIALELQVPFASPISGAWAEGLPGRFLSGDRLHPSAWGYGVMGERLAADLARLTSS